ncbi:arsenical-resistance protein 2 [Chaetomidium leptoderma]|uniref:Arsenical-resistance protein 2 n=1 Tax=Chaetomidium leptoderma TaxID=669021 RepID=A0AAN6VJX7_9PEZI|nr:arsenical-resistance protein 2 [Chaetomidium leptoderma]
MHKHGHGPHAHGHGHGHEHVHEHCLKMARREDGTPWWTDFPEPRSVVAQVEPNEVLELLQGHELSESKSRDFLLVDARRADCTGGTVRGAMNLPAHSFYPTRRTLYGLCKQAGINKVIFYCGESKLPRDICSSLGRGPRCAAWMQDYVQEVRGDLESQVMIGGIRGWVQAYGGSMMDGYDEKVWQVRAGSV